MHPEKIIKFYIDNHISTLVCANFQCIGAFFVPAAHLAVPHQLNFQLVTLISVQFFTFAPEILSKLSGTKKVLILSILIYFVQKINRFH